MTKDQYKIYGEATQLVWDGGNIGVQKKSVKANTEVEKNRLEVDLYTLRERVNQFFFGILLLNGQLVQNTLFQNDLQRNYDQISSYLDNGIANQADLDVVQVEQLNAIQARVRIDTSVKSYRRMLSAMIGEPVDEASVLQKPELEGLLISAQINRPELSLFEAHNEKKQIKMSKEHEVKINNYLCKNFYPLNNKKTWKINMQYQYRSTHCRRYLA